MKFALAFLGSALVAADTACFTVTPNVYYSNCSDANNCTKLAYCSRNGTACSTDSMTCTGDKCAAGTAVRNAKTCSKCADQCSGLDMAACGAAPSACSWNEQCFQKSFPSPSPAPPCSAATKDACVKDTYGCFWVSYTTNICGVASTPYTECVACDDDRLEGLRAPISYRAGQRCTWKAAGDYKNDFSITLNDFATASSGNCTTLPATEDKMAGDTAITNFAKAFGAFDPASPPAIACAKPPSNDASIALPSMAVLGLFMLTRV